MIVDRSKGWVGGFGRCRTLFCPNESNLKQSSLSGYRTRSKYRMNQTGIPSGGKRNKRREICVRKKGAAGWPVVRGAMPMTVTSQCGKVLDSRNRGKNSPLSTEDVYYTSLHPYPVLQHTAMQLRPTVWALTFTSQKLIRYFPFFLFPFIFFLSRNPFIPTFDY